MKHDNEFIDTWHFVRRVEGWLEFDEACFLYDVAKHLDVEGCILEIGSYKGRSTICLARGSQEGKRFPVYAIDKFYGFPASVDPSFLDTFKKNLAAAGCLNIVDVIVLSSDEAAFVFVHPIALLFIDGSHDYEQVKKDYENFSPLVVPGGVIIFHDYKYFPGVKKLVDEVKGNRKAVKYHSMCSQNLSNIAAWNTEVIDG